MILLVKKRTDTRIEQTKTNPHETLEFILNKQMKTFSFSPPKKMSEEEKWLLAVTSFEVNSSVFNIFDENNNFSTSIPGYWKFLSFLEDGRIDKLNNLPILRSQNDFKLHVDEVKKRGTQVKIGDEKYNLSDFDTSRNEKLEEIKSANYHDFEDFAYRYQLTYDEIKDILGKKNSINKNWQYLTSWNI